MTLKGLAELALNLIKGGFPANDELLETEDIEQYLRLSHAYISFANGNKGIEHKSNPIELKSNKAKVPKPYNVDDIRNIRFAGKNGQVLDNLIINTKPSTLQSGSSIFSKAVLNGNGEVDFSNIPSGATKVVFTYKYNKEENIEISDEIAYLILQDSFRLSQLDDKAKRDSTVNRSEMQDFVREQIKQYNNK